MHIFLRMSEILRNFAENLLTSNTHHHVSSTFFFDDVAVRTGGVGAGD